MLNDFDDEHSVSAAADDLSMISGSYRHNHRISSGVPFIEANYLEPSSRLMAGMAAPITKNSTTMATVMENS